MAENIAELNSIILPGFGSSVGGIISSPVGIMPTVGRRITLTFITPPASIAPITAGVISVYDGSIISPAHISSPICLICCHGAAGAVILAEPSSPYITSSIIITASQSSGTGSPVSTTVNPSLFSSTGAVSVAPKVSSALIAMPSMALAG